MSKTEVSGKQVKDGSIELVDLAPALAGDINTLKSDVSTLQNDVAIVQSDVGDLQTNTATSTYVDGAVQNANTAITALQGDVSTLQSDVSNKASTSAVTAIDLRVAALEEDPTTKTYVDQQVAGLVNAAPAALDTLNELAAALGSDPNFATTVSGQIGVIAADVAGVDARVASTEADILTLQSDVAGKASSASLATVATSGSYNDLSNKPSLFSGSYTDLTSKPTLATVATSGLYSDLSGTPSLATVATSGSYNDLSDKPTFSSDLNGLTDVTITTPSTDQVLKYNGTAWVNSAAPAAGATDLDGLSDVAITSAASGQFIVHNGTSFVNSRTISSAGSTPLTTVSSGGTSAEFKSSAGYNGIRVGTDGATGVPFVALDTNSSQKAYLAYWGDTTQRISLGHSSSTDIINYFNGGTYSGRVGIQTTTPGGQLAVTASATTTKGLVVQGASGQTANLFEVQQNNGTALFAINSSGQVNTSLLSVVGIGSNTTSFPNAGVYLDSNGGYSYATMHMVNSNGGMIDFCTTNEDFHGRILYDRVNHGYYIYTGANATPKVHIDREGYGTLWVGPGSASTKGLIVKSAASQTANLFEVQNSSGTAIFSVDKDGSVAAGTVPVARVTGLATVATSGSYNDLSNKPSIPSLTGYATESYVDSAVSSLVNSAPTALNTLNELATALGNDANFATTMTNALAAKADSASLADVATSGAYADLSGTPSLATVATSGAYADLSGTPSLATVATSGSYNDLSDKPTIPDSSKFSVGASSVDTTFSGITSKETNATVTTTDATETTLFSLALADDTTYTFDISLAARLSSTTAKGMYGATRFTVYRNNAGNATLAEDYGGRLEELDTYGNSGYDYTVTVLGSTVYVKVTGAASETVKWAANVRYVSVS